jgi:UDP-3-O-[3-hydroxymyristoyl] glucosamine N-acyltransferase
MTKIDEIIEFLGEKCLRIEVTNLDGEINGAAPVTPGESGCISFWTPKAKATFEEVVAHSQNSLILVPQGTLPKLFSASNLTVLEVRDPRTTYMQILTEFLVPARVTGVHERATVETTEIGTGVFIGSGAVIGPDVRIGMNCTIHANSVLLGKVILGNDVVIGPNTVIGFTGFGYGRDEDGTPVPFPHFGGVVIGDRVEIGGNTSIDQGTLTDTIIENDVKIDNLVHVSHNCHIESGAFVIASSILCGGVRVGKNSWIAPNSSILEKVEIGENVTIGLSSTVIKDVVSNDVVVGSPAKSIRRS